MLRFAVCTIDYRHEIGIKRRVNVRIGASLIERITSLLVRGPRHKFAWITFLLCLLALARAISGHSSTAAISTAAAALFLFLAWARGEFIR